MDVMGCHMELRQPMLPAGSSWNYIDENVMFDLTNRARALQGHRNLTASATSE